jgi:uncharacterized damage-inducible protein DinB
LTRSHLHRQQVLDQWCISYFSGLKVAELGDVIKFDFMGGGKGELSFTEVILYIINYGTYHRGFVSDMIIK